MFVRGRSGSTFVRVAGASLVTGLVAVLLGSAAAGAATTPRPRVAASVAGLLDGVACASAKSCVAVGMRSSGASLAEKWNGTKWSVVSSPDPSGSSGSTLWGVACTSAKSCLAVGSYNNSSHTTTLPAAESWNGTKWSVVSVPAPSGATSATLESISCASATNCQAVGTSGDNTLAESWNGSKWKIVASPSPVPGKPNVLSGVACPATSECWAVGLDFSVSEGGTLTEKWNGSKWSVVSTPTSKDGQLLGVGCFSKSNCMSGGIGDSLFAIGQRWNGSKWIAATPVTPSGATDSELVGVACPAAATCQAVGNYGTSSGTPTLAEGWNGTTWAIENTPSISGSSFATLSGVACTSASTCWAVGESISGSTTSPVIEGWNGKSWKVSAS
jgi:hypothetical protein